MTKRNVSVFSDAMKQVFARPIRDMLEKPSGWSWVGEPDPWDDAVKWIEQNQQAKREWPWPAR